MSYCKKCKREKCRLCIDNRGDCEMCIKNRIEKEVIVSQSEIEMAWIEHEMFKEKQRRKEEMQLFKEISTYIYEVEYPERLKREKILRSYIRDQEKTIKRKKHSK